MGKRQKHKKVSYTEAPREQPFPTPRLQNTDKVICQRQTQIKKEIHKRVRGVPICTHKRMCVQLGATSIVS